jgi:hypothetical protein
LQFSRPKRWLRIPHEKNMMAALDNRHAGITLPVILVRVRNIWGKAAF